LTKEHCERQTIPDARNTNISSGTHLAGTLNHYQTHKVPCATRQPNETAIHAPATTAWDFVVIGVQKGGTTDLTGHLQNHPELCAGGEARLISSLNMFLSNKSRPWLQRNMTHKIAWTRQKFRCGSACATRRGGVDPEASFALLAFPQMAAQLWAAPSHVRLVLLLREPIQRAWSAYRMGQQRNFRYEARYASFAECVDVEARQIEDGRGVPPPRRSTIYRGLYAPLLDALAGAGFQTQLRRRGASDGRLLVLISERALADPAEAHRAVFGFLGVAAHDTAGWRSAPGRGAQRSSTAEHGTPPKLNVSAARRLYALYRASTTRTYGLLGERVSEWEAFYIPLRGDNEEEIFNPTGRGRIG
jgi:hypothetical protein